MREIRPGLRLINKTNDVAKVSLVVAAGDELEVSEEIAAQIAAQSAAFVDTGSDDAGKALPYPPREDTDDEKEDEPETLTRKRPASRRRKG